MFIKRILLAVPTLLLLAAPAVADGPGHLVVEVGKLRNLRGHLACLLFKSADGFPDQPSKAYARVSLTPEGNDVRCVFKGLPAGTYAVSVLHDEDKSGDMNTNFVGLPTEGYGASNNKLPALSPPDFEDSTFSLAEGEDRTLSVTLKY